MLYLKSIMLAILILALAVGSLAWGTETQAPAGVDNYFSTLSYSSYSNILEQSGDFTAQPADTLQLNQDIYGGKSKSTRKAFLYSLILPGAGELYGGSKLKAAAFLGLEALFWVSYFHYDNKADDKKKEYRVYADANWQAGDYRDSLIYTYFSEISPNKPVNQYNLFTYQYDSVTVLDASNYTAYESTLVSNDAIIFAMEESLSIADRDPGQFGFTHHSVNVSNQEYYENIGKYDQFSWGWGGTQLDPLSALRASYLGMRHDANSLYDKAKWSMVASLTNHVLSAVDAALTVKSFNRKQDRFSEASLKIRMIPEPEGLSPRAVFTLKFQ